MPKRGKSKKRRRSSLKKGSEGPKLKGGYLPLKVRISPDGSNYRTIFFKKHVAKESKRVDDWGNDDDDDAGDRTIFATNIPFNWDYSNVIELFSVFGSVDSVLFQEFRTNNSNDKKKKNNAHQELATQSAQVIFADDVAALRALSTDLKDSVQPFIAGSKPCGIEKYIAEYKQVRPNMELLQNQVDRFMQVFDERIEKQKEAMRNQGPVIDDDGFQLVTYKKTPGRMNLREQMEEEEAAVRKRRQAKKRRKNQVVHFYKSQERDAKKQKLEELRRKFEQDKARIAKMKAARKFKPF